MGEFYQFAHVHPELKQGEIGEHFGKTQSGVSKRFTARKHAGFTSGAPHNKPDEDPQPIATVHPSSPEGSLSGAPPATHKRGFVPADDVWDTIHRYAAARHGQIAPVADLAFHTFFAQLGEEVRGE